MPVPPSPSSRHSPHGTPKPAGSPAARAAKARRASQESEEASQDGIGMSWAMSSFQQDVVSSPLAQGVKTGNRRGSAEMFMDSLGSAPNRRGSTDTPTLGRRSAASTASISDGMAPIASSASGVSVAPRRSIRERFSVRARVVVRSNAFALFMFVLSVYILFGDDMRLAYFQLQDDGNFDILTICVIVLFSTELIVMSIAIEDYFLSFFFTLDVTATLSLFLDLAIIREQIEGSDSVAESNAPQEVNSVSEWARAGRSSRVGTRVARVLRAFRIIRVARLFKRCPCRRRSIRSISAFPGEEGEEEDYSDESGKNQSRVGKKLSDRTTLWVIVLVLAMLMIVPILDQGEPNEMMLSSAYYGADVVHQAWQAYVTSVESGVERFVQDQLRRVYELELLMYMYYHSNYAAKPQETRGGVLYAKDSMSKLCFIAYDNAGRGDPVMSHHILVLNPNETDWDAQLLGPGDFRNYEYVVGSFPRNIQERVAQPWNTLCEAPNGNVQGVSLLQGTLCPWAFLRRSEIRLFDSAWRDSSVYSSIPIRLVFDTSERSQLEAKMAAVQTIFIVLAFSVGAAFFSRDVDKMVLEPIERMIVKVELIRQNPLYAIKLGHETYRKKYLKEKRQRALVSWIDVGMGVGLTEVDPWLSSTQSSRVRSEAAQEEKKRSRLRRCCSLIKRCCCFALLICCPRCVRRIRRLSGQPVEENKAKATLETKVLENTIIKLGSLLALGFGEAGIDIIGHNLGGDSANDIDAMMLGRKVYAIYGYCHIKDFLTTTEVLQEQTMVFVNQVADIVHRIATEYLGAPNKNVGEAFLLIWRMKCHDVVRRSHIADLSVMALVQVLVAINRDRDLATYRGHPALLAKLPHFRVRLGFGLHLGWSIEGAIGSEFKLDPSYLSSHVNMAVTLESLVRHYGVVMLLSEALVRKVSVQFAPVFRTVDNVRMRGSNEPTRLFTLDLHYESLGNDYQPKRHINKDTYRARLAREAKRAEKLQPNYSVFDVFVEDKHIRRMRSPYFLSFFQEFEKAYLNYEAGEWGVASQVLRETAVMLKTIVDGPSCALLDYMAAFHYKAPPGWPGYRSLAVSRTHVAVRGGSKELPRVAGEPEGDFQEEISRL